MKAIVWSKPDCPFCVQATQYLESKGIVVEEKKIGSGVSKEDLFEAVPTARSVPQIFLDGNYIGGFNDLKQYFMKEEHVNR